MARAPLDGEMQKWIDEARAYPIGDLADARDWPLRGNVERVGPCPRCGGRDRFGLNTHKNSFICRQCRPEGGGVIDLVIIADGCDFLAACETLTGRAPPRGQGTRLTPEELAERERERNEKAAARERLQEKFREDERQRCKRLWLGGKPAAGTIVEEYLARRRVSLPPRAHLKFSPEVRLYVDRREIDPGTGKARVVSEVVHTGPAMLAAILGPLGVFSGLHTTWIDLRASDGKARVPDPKTGEFVPAKKVRGSQKGGRIELQRHPAPRVLVVGEGIETTLSIRDDLLEHGRDLSDFAFWSAINLGNLGGPAADKVKHPTERDLANRAVKIQGPTPDGVGIPVPDSVEEIVILGDGDSDPFLTTTTHARAAARWARPGRVIRVAMAPPGTDFNALRCGA